MKRRKFLITSGTTILTGTAISSTQQPTLGLEFELSAVPNEKPSEIDAITIQFTKFQLTPNYIDDSQPVELTVTLELGSYQSTKKKVNITLNNGQTKDVQNNKINPITIDNLNIPSNESVLEGNLKIELEHPDITETYNQQFTITASEFIDAEGGTTVTDVSINDQNYRIHAFETTGSDSFKINKAPTNASIDILLVGGGGGGGENDAGGGGAGGLIYKSDYTISEGTYNLSIGSGGTGASKGSSGFGQSGEDTTGFGLTAIGGGGAAPQRETAKDGGSGGGAGHADSTGGSALQPGSEDGGFGSDGGEGKVGSQEPYPGGGGGGASQSGASPSTTSERGHGGDGKDYSDTFTEQFGENGRFAGGGGGGTQLTPTSNGGTGGGGDGGHANNSNNINPQDGQLNTGGGGGGTGEGGYQNAGNGGSGIILIRYPIS